MSLNTITIMGRLTRDPELKTTTNGTPVTSFDIACDSDYKDKSGNRKTIFVNCVAWKATAEYISKYFQKGRMAIVKGRLDTSEWTDKNGSKRTNVFVDVESVYFGDSKKTESEGTYGGAYTGTDSGYRRDTTPSTVSPHSDYGNPYDSSNDDDLPF